MRALACAGLLLAAQAAWARPDTPGSTDLYKYAAGDTVESIGSAGGHFKVFFTRAGVNAVPLDDANGNGTPDAVEEVAGLYEQVLAFYQSLGYHTPLSDASTPGNNGGDGRFDVYLLDFAGRADGTFVRESCSDNVCSGYMVQENDFAGYGYPSRNYANRVLSSHEFFHAVQAAYDDSESTIIGEGTAVWATEKFDPTLSDFEGFVRGYLDRPDRSLFLPLPGPVDAFSYGSAIFFQFLDEKYPDSIIRELWETTPGPPGWFDGIDGVLQRHQSSFADAMFTFARWNLFTKDRANPSLGYARGQGYPLVRIDPATAPVAMPMYRVFASSVSYLGVPPGSRSTVALSLVVPDGIDGSLLRAALAVRHGSSIAEPVLADVQLRASVDATGADEVIAIVCNTAQSGESLKPGLCIGAPDEVEACRVQLGAAPTPMPTMTASGCSVGAGARPSPLWPALFFVAVALRLKIRRRR